VRRLLPRLGQRLPRGVHQTVPWGWVQECASVGQTCIRHLGFESPRVECMNGQTAAASWPPNDVVAIAITTYSRAIAFQERLPIEYLILFIRPLSTRNARYMCTYIPLDLLVEHHLGLSRYADTRRRKRPHPRRNPCDATMHHARADHVSKDVMLSNRIQVVVPHC
jgi:hypothetical protein